jgi:hypothetical protein
LTIVPASGGSPGAGADSLAGIQLERVG